MSQQIEVADEQALIELLDKAKASAKKSELLKVPAHMRTQI